MNEVHLTGKVMNAYVNADGYFTCIFSNVHDHHVNGFNDISESVFRGFLPDTERSKHISIVKGDRVMITGHLRQDRKITSGDNERKRINLYIDEIELVKPAGY